MKRFLVAGLLIALLLVIPVFAAVPVDPMVYAMYATDYTAGDVVPVLTSSPLRLNPANALGPFDAVAGGGFDQKFFETASRQWTNYTFAEDFCNVDWAPDIEFCEVTWGSGASWHTEAVKVYLTDVYVRDAGGNIVPYGATDDGIGYYAGIAWNRVGVQFVPEATRLAVAQSYFSGTRDFDSNTFSYSGTFGWTQFNLPDEVIYAKGVYLVDITSAVYNLDGSASTYAGATGGYDLDAIRVYKCAYAPYIDGDTATGYGTRILTKGNWFMYNVYPEVGGDNCYDIQAGNPNNGLNIIGEYCIQSLDGGLYVANYDIDETIQIGDWIYDIEVTDEHLGIDNIAPWSYMAVPGQDDNQDFEVPFADLDGLFAIFAHFEIEYV